MEGVRSRRGRESNKSPERLIRSLNHHQQQDDEEEERPIFRRVQVVYYLTRNGNLQHPHFIEVIAPVNQPLRLRDVINRLTVLRGNCMPSLYAWSCKRSYRNGFVWNDLADNDVIYPSDCAEYVLKGSEITEKFHEVHVNNNRPMPGPIQVAPKGRLLRSKPKPQNKTTSFDDEEEDGEYQLSQEKTSYTSSTETVEFTEPKPNVVDKTRQNLPVRSDSSELTRSDPMRVEDGDPVDPPGSGRGSIWLQMISCGHIAKYYAPTVIMNSRQNEENLRKGALCKNIVKKTVVDDEREMIKFMSENPRFGNPQTEEKEYFSGSIVEAVSQERVTTEPTLRRSNSFNEERPKIVEMAKKEKKEERSMVKVKCIPRRKSSSCLMSSSKQIKKLT